MILADLMQEREIVEEELFQRVLESIIPLMNSIHNFMRAMLGNMAVNQAITILTLFLNLRIFL